MGVVLFKSSAHKKDQNWTFRHRSRPGLRFLLLYPAQAEFSQTIPTFKLFPPEERIGVEVSNIEGKSFGEILPRGNLRVEQVLPVPVHLLAVVRRLAATNIGLHIITLDLNMNIGSKKYTS